MKLNKRFFIKFSIYLLGLILVGLGVQVVVYTHIGAAPIDAFVYYLANIYLQISGKSSNIQSIMGVTSLIFGTFTVLVLFAISRNKKLIYTWFNIFLISGIIAAWGVLFDNINPIQDNLFIKIVVAFVGVVIISFGVFLVLVTEFPAGPPEEVMRLIDSKVNHLLISKLITELIYLTLAFIAMIVSMVIIGKGRMEFTQVGIFTIFTLILTALLIALFDKIYRIIISNRRKGKMTMKINQYIDHTKLGPTVTKKDIEKLVEEAKKYEFFSVCVNPTFVKYAKELVKGSNVKIATVIGFPHGTHTPDVKVFETEEAIKNGADEIDMVINVNALKDKDYDLVLSDIVGVVKAAKGKVVKVIIETCYLAKEEIVKASELVVKAKAHFVKTSTGFGPGGATVEDVELIEKTVNGKAEIKASGGIRSYQDAIKMIEAGATRLGASKGVEIMEGVKIDDTNTSYWIKRQK